ncbi:hypothetical protein ACFO1B_23435 [Dactylosporangium siamense]|uniref:Cytochrome C biogenesis protein transmembrane domain-containing protein n=1 Tax=Dactylosporangium siamense TaxID=685454 RepID=A0A919PRH5_9ACTN|nr:hypothetical protein [Dactylosporangium siamense]GIG47150.1 hypothetical protein Dsi01nite_051910 [Dactylosporangium siamense]
MTQTRQVSTPAEIRDRSPDPFPPGQTSLFVNGILPRRRWLVLLVSVVVGLFIAYAWSSELVDREIGFNVANGILGHDANTTPIDGIGAGILFAFVTGLAGSFTACNIAVFGAVTPMVGHTASRSQRLLQTLRPLGWLAVGMIPVSAVYGAIVGLVGTRMPQFSTASFSSVSPRILQAMIVFGIIGLVMLIMGLSALKYIPDPLGPVSRRFPNAPLVLMGVLIGGLLIGRPYPLFRAMFRHAAETHDPWYGAFAFTLQSVGNIVVMAVLFLALSYLIGGRLRRWLAARPARITALTAGAFLIAALFMLGYWELRLLGRFGYLWFPTAPWNA